jgi:hypothetical protein
MINDPNVPTRWEIFRDDIHAVATMGGLSCTLVASVVFFSTLSDMLTRQLVKMGLMHNSFSQWTLTAAMFFVCCGVTFAVIARCIDKKWWWK